MNDWLPGDPLWREWHKLPMREPDVVVTNRGVPLPSAAPGWDANAIRLTLHDIEFLPGTTVEDTRG